MKAREMDVLIIGAGPAGTCAAALLEKEGFSSVIVERTKFPRFVIGESLLPRCMDHLDAAGLLAAVREKNFIVKYGGQLIREKSIARFDFREKFGVGWNYTYQVPRADFDMALANAVAARGVPILYEHEVTAVNINYPDIEVVVKPIQGSSIVMTPRFVLDASGYGRVLPRLLALERPSDFPVREALATHFRGDKRPDGDAAGNIWVVSHHARPDVWYWIIPFSNGLTSVGAVGTPDYFAMFTGTPTERLYSMLRDEPSVWERCSEAQFDFEPRAIKGYSAAVKQLYGDGYALLGNAAEFLDPVFSSGVTIALESARAAVAVLSKQLRGESANWQEDFTNYIMKGVDCFRAYVKAWYDGTLPTIFYSSLWEKSVVYGITAVLAGYVWGDDNLYAREPERALKLISDLCRERARVA